MANLRDNFEYTESSSFEDIKVASKSKFDFYKKKLQAQALH